MGAFAGLLSGMGQVVAQRARDRGIMDLANAHMANEETAKTLFHLASVSDDPIMQHRLFEEGMKARTSGGKRYSVDLGKLSHEHVQEQANNPPQPQLTPPLAGPNGSAPSQASPPQATSLPPSLPAPSASYFGGEAGEAPPSASPFPAQGMPGGGMAATSSAPAGPVAAAATASPQQPPQALPPPPGVNVVQQPAFPQWPTEMQGGTPVPALFPTSKYKAAMADVAAQRKAQLEEQEKTNIAKQNRKLQQEFANQDIAAIEASGVKLTPLLRAEILTNRRLGEDQQKRFLALPGVGVFDTDRREVIQGTSPVAKPTNDIVNWKQAQAGGDPRSFSDWYQAFHPGKSSDPSSLKEYKSAVEDGSFDGTYMDFLSKKANLRTPAPQKPPQALVMVPGANGEMVATLVRPGSTVAPGALTASGMSSANTATAATRTMAEAAPKVLSLASRLRNQIEAQKAQLGPLSSRWSEYMAGKVGAPNEAFTKLRTDAGLLQTLLMRMHVGARGGKEMMEHFKGLLDSSKQSPENMLAALEEIENYANDVGKKKGAGAELTPPGKVLMVSPQGQEGYVPAKRASEYERNGYKRK